MMAEANNRDASERHTADVHRIERAIAALAGAFATDGYDLAVVGFEPGHVDFAIAAHEGACAECLVPYEMMAGLIRTTLPEDLAGSEIKIKYPDVMK
jgi:Fe-S cluster biogenesis protein NfuA